MGYRTVVVLNNDQQDEWSKDRDLGVKISNGLSWKKKADLGYGKVVECAHADSLTLMMLDGFDGDALAYYFWNSSVSREDMQIALLKGAAAKLGYVLSKKSKKKAKDKKSTEVVL